MGADIGARRIKVAGVAADAGSPELVWAVDVPTPAGIFGSDGQFDAVAAGRVLGQLLAGAPSHGALAGAVLLPAASLRVRRLQTAAVDQSALKRILADDSELRVPGVSVEGLHHAVYALSDTPAGARGDAGRQLVAAAARRDVIRAYSAAGAASGIEPLRLAAPAVALANLHRELHTGELDRPVLLIHVGSARSELVVVHGGAPLLSLPLVQGTDQLFEAIRSAPSEESVDPDVLLRDPAGSVPALEEWVGRVRGSHRTAVGAAERHLRCNLDELPVRVSGGIARYPVVVERLAAAISAPVGVLDPSVRFREAGTADVFAPALVLAVGAALEARAAQSADSGEEGAGGTVVVLNLSVLDGTPSATSVRPMLIGLAGSRAVWVSLVVAALLALAVPSALMSRLQRGERELARTRTEYRREAAAVAADSARVSALRADSVRLAGTLGTLAVLEANRYGWPKLMHAAAEALPPYAWLEGLELDPGEPLSQSRVRVSAIAPAQADVSRYERVLAGSGGVRDMRLESSESLAAGPFALVGFRLVGSFGAVPGPADQPQPEGAGYNVGALSADSSHAAP